MTPEDTVHLVPLTELLTLANAGYAMRRAQRAYFAARRDHPHARLTAEYRAARAAEARFDALLTDALRRESVPLPGIG